MLFSLTVDRLIGILQRYFTRSAVKRTSMGILARAIVRPAFSSKALVTPWRRPVHSRPYSQQLPFDLQDEDEKYRDLNQMYVDMFNEPRNDQSDNKNREVKSHVSELDELNEDLNDLLSVGYHKLTAAELKQVVRSPGRFILQSLSNNPYYNLALESYVFSNTPAYQKANSSFNNQRLLFYINRNCVVIGKNQNVWRELHVQAVKDKGYELLRRFSGGGTVVHDLGNVNYSFMNSRELFRREYFNEVIVKNMKEFYPNLDLKLNPRGDIALGNRKVSGSAFKISRGKSYHHGTMLINSKLDQFHGLLKPNSMNGITWKCNSVDSVRSEVGNVPLGSTQHFIDVCAEGFKKEFDDGEGIPFYYCDEDITINEEIQNYMSTLCSEEWKYMSCPKFEVHMELGDHLITVEKGTIVKSSIPSIVGLSFNEFTKNLSQYNINADLIL